MQNEIRIFESKEFGQLEVLMVENKPYFPAIECAKVLGYSNAKDAVLRHCPEDGVVKHDLIDRLGRKQAKKFISEGNLYRLIIRSKLPSAVEFEKWVFDKVLPSIRQYGAYITDDVLDQLIENPEAAARLFSKLKEERSQKEALEEQVKKFTPKVRYYDIILQCPDAVLATVIAKDYGMSCVKFNKLLYALGIQFRYKTNKTWVLYQEHEGKGYTVSRTYHRNNMVYIQMCWTQKGRLFLYNYLKSHGILPTAERPEQLQLTDTEPPTN